MAKAKKQNTTTDPVYAAIEKHQKAMRELYQGLKTAPGTLGPDPKIEKKCLNREGKTRDDLTSTAPTTLQGLLALVAYVNGVKSGKLSPYGKPDNTFEEPETLYAVLASAEELLAEQVGRSASAINIKSTSKGSTEALPTFRWWATSQSDQRRISGSARTIPTTTVSQSRRRRYCCSAFTTSWTG
ncbi:hypothetical protein J4G43_038075 [Bradyrhizobium barranii subsp. barranii]|uniref:Uncharacterized protein n=1 Tax=Bradyrhizobium barranii subsp. barranii TaxID=2823807 RepID=A0A939MFK2_9BRAD|nr:hypothetical protein [Bradyrhizobium barranii]UEM10421.1 hypothetical protein J4G43_038075 [Bradyrhizobium barranii subsp. barranii]